MNADALGMIEAKGSVDAIEVVDVTAKVANVPLVGYEKIDSGLVIVMVGGDVGAVKATTDVGATSMAAIGKVVLTYAIPCSRTDAEKVLPHLEQRQQIETLICQRL